MPRKNGGRPKTFKDARRFDLMLEATDLAAIRKDAKRDGRSITEQMRVYIKRGMDVSRQLDRP